MCELSSWIVVTERYVSTKLGNAFAMDLDSDFEILGHDGDISSRKRFFDLLSGSDIPGMFELVSDTLF